MAGGDWTDAENDATVAAYFEMLAEEAAGRPFVKAERNRALQAVIGRSRAAIEFKWRNVSAILTHIGETRIRGYAPASNYQDALCDAVGRWLSAHPAWLVRPPRALDAGGAATAHPDQGGFAEESVGWSRHPDMLRIGPAPSQTNRPPPADLEQAERTAARFDAALRDAANRRIGEAGEALALRHERAALRQARREDLAEQVEWVAKTKGDGAGYDIGSFDPEGAPRLIEVKTTRGWDRTPFHITPNELRVADERRDAWVLMRIWDVDGAPRAFELRPPLQDHASLTPTSFLARLH